MKQLLWMELHRFKRMFFYGLVLIIMLFEFIYIFMNRDFVKSEELQDWQFLLIIFILGAYPVGISIISRTKKSVDYLLTLPVKRYLVYITPAIVAAFGSGLLFLVNVFLIKILPLPENEYGLTFYEVFLDRIPGYYLFFIFLMFPLIWGLSILEKLEAKSYITIWRVFDKTVIIWISSLLLFIIIILLTNYEDFFNWYQLMWVPPLEALAIISYYLGINSYCRYPTSIIKTGGIFLVFYLLFFGIHASSAYAGLWSDDEYYRYSAFHTYFKVWPEKALQSYGELFEKQGYESTLESMTLELLCHRKEPYPLKDLWRKGINREDPLRKGTAYTFIALRGRSG